MLGGLFLLGCQLNPSRSDSELAAEIARPAKLAEQLRTGGPFVLTTRERLTGHSGGDLTIYLEGDGMAWLTRTQVSPDPTPDDPVALRLAALDASPNVAWIARPCQYTPKASNPECKPFYWTQGRFAPQVVDSIHAVISAIKRDAGAQRVHLVGYSGGGGLAVLVAARRDDVASIRTVAGNLDHRAFTSHHKVTPMDASQNPADVAPRVQSIPQIHWVGSEDKTVPELIARSYVGRMSSKVCASLQTVAGASHSQGWTSRWAELLKVQPSCASR
jgi:pimeloyl-ACP methyl ester carboxylesterase